MVYFNVIVPLKSVKNREIKPGFVEYTNIFTRSYDEENWDADRLGELRDDLPPLLDAPASNTYWVTTQQRGNQGNYPI